jgi:type IX secretion system PorP/SprF family membrane protein
MQRIFITLIILFLLIKPVFPQDMPVHEQYLFDYMLVNPSFAGLSEITTVKMIHRQQWIGIENAPKTSFLLFKHRLNDRTGGIGGYIFSDQNGPNSWYGVQLSWSFQSLLNSKRYDKHILSFGMSFKGIFHMLDETKFERDIYDPIISYSRRVTFNPGANAGIMYSYRQSFIGFGFDNLLQYSDRMYNMTVEPVSHVLMNAHTGHIFPLGRRLQIRPSLLFKTNFHGLNQLDVNCKFNLFGDKEIKSVYIRANSEFWAGFSYRQTLDAGHFAALSMLPSFGFSYGAFTFMYLYDIGLTRLQNYHYGTHQICLGLRFFPDKYVNWGKHNIPAFIDDF